MSAAPDLIFHELSVTPLERTPGRAPRATVGATTLARPLGRWQRFLVSGPVTVRCAPARELALLARNWRRGPVVYPS